MLSFGRTTESFSDSLTTIPSTTSIERAIQPMDPTTSRYGTIGIRRARAINVGAVTAGPIMISLTELKNLSSSVTTCLSRRQVLQPPGGITTQKNLVGSQLHVPKP